MARNKLTDLNDHLFQQLERLNDDEIDPVQMETEVARSKAINNISKTVIELFRLKLDAIKVLTKGESSVQFLEPINNIFSLNEGKKEIE